MAKQVVQKVSFEGDLMTIKYPMIGKQLTIDCAALPHQAAFRNHGAKQRFGDLESGDKSGAKKYAKAKEYAEHLAGGGSWRMAGERDDTELVIEAVHKAYPAYKVEDLKQAVEFDEEQIAEWKENAKVKAAIAEIRAARAKQRVRDEKPEDIVVKLK